MQNLKFINLCAVCNSDCIRNCIDLMEKFVLCQGNFYVPFPPTESVNQLTCSCATELETDLVVKVHKYSIPKEKFEKKEIV